MTSLGTWRRHLRFASGYPRYLREKITLEQARAEIRRRRDRREANLIGWVKRIVFELGRTPYLALFQMAGCEAGDFESLVLRDGVDAALETLRRSGVWVAYEEFKGRRPMNRGSVTIATKPGAFDNPLLGGGYEVSSGGSTGPGTRVMIDLDYLRSRAVTQLVEEASKGRLGLPWACWVGVLPDAGLTMLLSRPLFDGLPERWFSPVSFSDTGAPLSMRLAHHVAVGVARWLGEPFPRPEVVPIDQAHRIAAWLHERSRGRETVILQAAISRQVRVATAAREAGFDFSKVVLRGGAEPPTDAKVAEIRRSGASFDTNYAFTEAGPVGTGCMNPASVNDLHFFDDRLALIQHDRPVGDTTVPAFLFTSLLDVAPKLLLNVESDDYGVVEDRRCGCGVEAEGFGRHIRDIRSFSKLTGGGMTLVGGEALRLIEEALPRRFSASPLDFQLREEEEQGRTRVLLVVSPAVRATDGELLEAFKEGLRRGSPAASLAQAIWGQSGALSVVREEPRWTRRGKLLPLDLANRHAPPEAGA